MQFLQWEKVGPKICATSVIFKKLPKENDPRGENAPNLVTLASKRTAVHFISFAFVIIIKHLEVSRLKEDGFVCKTL
jgi:uncharacterized membrane protein YidH (DUF202 family)